MDKFIVSNWFEKRAALNIQTFEVEGVVFELMALDEDLIERVKDTNSYNELLSVAADAGISYNRKRVADDIELSKDLALLWGLGDLDIDADPCIKYRVGEQVCDISGLTQYCSQVLEQEEEAALQAELDAEAAREIKVGDHKLPGNTLIDDMNDDPSVSVDDLRQDNNAANVA